MIKFILGLAFCFSNLSFAQNLSVRDPLPADSSSFSTWSSEFGTRFRALPESSRGNQSECREFSQIPGTIICLTGSVAAVGNYQGRASLYAEGAGVDDSGNNVGKGQVVERNSITYRTYSEQIGGTDIRSGDLQRFYSSVEQHCQCACADVSTCSTANFCLSDAEREMHDRVIAPAEARGRPYVVIMAPYEYGIIVEHEILHAQYFNDQAYREAVDDFWANKLTAAERASITNVLGDSYDRNDEYLIRNEFQAYALKSEGSPFEAISTQFRARFLAHLSSRGVRPVLLSSGATP